MVSIRLTRSQWLALLLALCGRRPNVANFKAAVASLAAQLALVPPDEGEG